MTNSSQQDFPRLVLRKGFDELTLLEFSDKGYLPAYAEYEDGRLFPVYFIDPVRLQQDLELSMKEIEPYNEPYVTEPGMVAVDSFTRENLTRVIEGLHERHFFDYLKPLEAQNERWP